MKTSNEQFAKYSPEERDIKGKRCRYFRAYDLWVGDNGWLIAKAIGSTGKYKFHAILKDSKGRKYVITERDGKEEKLYLDFAVVVCFCKRHPNDGCKYDIIHKDGEIGNDYYGNLIWEKRGDY